MLKKTLNKKAVNNRLFIFLFTLLGCALSNTLSAQSLAVAKDFSGSDLYVTDTESPQPDKITIRVNDAILTDLKSRLQNTRWPDELENSKWEYGTNLNYLKTLTQYWINDFNWREQEVWLNSFDHYKSNVNSFGIHYIHQKSNSEDAIPILLLHGWPGSFVQMLKLVPFLTTPKEHGFSDSPSFHVVVASLPGYGFSDRAKAPNMDMEAMASLMSTLMTDTLGYEQYAVRGGDIGGTVIDQMARNYPEQLIGAHLTQIIAAGGRPIPENATQAEIDFLNISANLEISYAQQHASKPQTLAYGLNDSPVGLASWILEKYYFWGDTEGNNQNRNIENRFNKDFLLTTLTSYWATQTINPSIRTYYDMVRSRGSANKISVPTAFLMSPKDMFPPPPKEWAERSHNVVRYNVANTGGHFLEWEEPEIVAQDIQEFFTDLLKNKTEPRIE